MMTQKRSVLLFDKKRKGDSREGYFDTSKNNRFAPRQRMSEMQKMLDEVDENQFCQNINSFI